MMKKLRFFSIVSVLFALHLGANENISSPK